MEHNATYQQEATFCTSARCRKCRDGKGHRPYWYAYRTEGGHIIRTSIGRNLPATRQPTEKPHPLLCITTLGRLRIEHLAKANRARRAVETDREQIMDALWPEATVEDAARQLDRSIHEVRQLLETTQARQHTWQIVHLQQEVVSLAGQSTLWADAEAFESLVSSVHRVSDHREAEQVLEQATALYTGTYLPQEHTSRASSRREVLHMAWIGAMMELVDLRLARGAWGDAMILLDRLLAIEHANEGAVRRMMNVLAWQHRRGEVRRASNDPYTTIPIIINRERRRTLFPCLCITT